MDIATLQARLQELHDNALGIRATAEAEKRDLTDEETAQLKELFADFSRVDEQIKLFAKLDQNHDHLHRSNGRMTDPDPMPSGGGNNTQDRDFQAAPRREPAPQIREVDLGTRMRSSERGSWGWRSFGEFAAGVRRACVGGGFVDPRLDYRGQPASYGSEGTDADGGYALPPDFRQAIRTQLDSVESILPRTDRMVTSSNSITVPIDAVPVWNAASPATGIRAYWTAEAAQKVTSKPLLDQQQVRLHKLAVLVPMTDELLQDVPAMDSYLRTKAPQIIAWETDNAIINGSGNGQPLGILNTVYNNALISVAAESGQVADTINFRNIANMWTRMPGAFRGNAVWLINHAVETQLMVMAAPTDSTTPIYLPGGNAAQAPFATLFGRPVIPHMAMPALGDLGDIVFVDLNQYMTVTKGGGVQTDVSIHLWFDYDITAFRFVFRVGGLPWWKAPVDPAVGTLTLSPYVALEARA